MASFVERLLQLGKGLTPFIGYAPFMPCDGLDLPAGLSPILPLDIHRAVISTPMADELHVKYVAAVHAQYPGSLNLSSVDREKSVLTLGAIVRLLELRNRGDIALPHAFVMWLISGLTNDELLELLAKGYQTGWELDWARHCSEFNAELLERVLAMPALTADDLREITERVMTVSPTHLKLLAEKWAGPAMRKIGFCSVRPFTAEQSALLEANAIPVNIKDREKMEKKAMNKMMLAISYGYDPRR